MLELTVAPQVEALADPHAPDYDRLKTALNEQGTSSAEKREPLYHQWRTYQALKDAEIVVNSYNTGTGKTQAALLRLLDLDANYKRDQIQERASVLFIAPTNELLRQHEGDVLAFIARNDLPHHVLRLDARRIRELGGEHLSNEFNRPSKQLDLMLQNPGSVLKDTDGQPLTGHTPYVLITNPDIFYYALYGLGNRHEQHTLFNHFLDKFNYIIVDEFHYYNAKQLANFLFFFTLLREWRYFAEDGRRVCLLTATPNEEVTRYLQRLVTDDDPLHLAYVAPGADPTDLRMLPALAPLRLRLYNAEESDMGLVDLATREKDTVFDWLNRGRHGAIISSALWPISRIYERYGGDKNDHLGRLTGPERKEGRERASVADLMLATPTVDIGYNFARPGKDRQSIDFLLFDGRYADEFVQRMGRAGRVLGRRVYDTPSDVWAVVPDVLLAALQPWAGREITRPELAAVVQKTLAPRNGIYGYVRSGAIAEAFLPIYNIKRNLLPEDVAWGDKLFVAVKQTYGTGESGRWTFEALTRLIKYYQYMRERIPGLQREADARAFEVGPESIRARHLAQQFDDGRPADEIDSLMPDLQSYVQAAVRGFRNSIAKRDKFIIQRKEDIEKYYVMQARFNFRDSYQPPRAIIYDPQHFLSSEEYNVYSVIHLAQNYEARWSDDAARVAEWKGRLNGLLDEEVALCCEIRALLEERLPLQFYLGNPGLEKPLWEGCYVSQLAALRGFRLRPALERGGKVSAELNDIFERSYFAFYAVPAVGPEARAMNSLKRTTALFTNKLVVNFGDEGEAEYLIVLGSAALMVECEPKIMGAKHAAFRADKGAYIC